MLMEPILSIQWQNHEAFVTAGDDRNVTRMSLFRFPVRSQSDKKKYAYSKDDILATSLGPRYLEKPTG